MDPSKIPGEAELILTWLDIVKLTIPILFGITSKDYIQKKLNPDINYVLYVLKPARPIII